MYRQEPLFWRPPWPAPGARGDGRFVPLANNVLLREAVLGAQRSMAHFLATALAGRAEAAVTGAGFPGLEPVADFDDDGFCDDAETAAGADPHDPLSVPTGAAKGCARDLGW